MISISINEVVDQVLAMSALHNVGATKERRELLCRENVAAIKRVVVDTAARLLMGVANMVAETNVDAVNSEREDLITVELKDAEVHEGLARKALEDAIAGDILESVYGVRGVSAEDKFVRYFRLLPLRRERRIETIKGQRC